MPESIPGAYRCRTPVGAPSCGRVQTDREDAQRRHPSDRRRSDPEEEPSEAHLSTQHPQAGQEPRLPGPNVHQGWTFDHSQPTPEGPGQAVGLTGAVRDRRTFAALRTNGLRVRRGPLSLTYLDDGAEGGTRLAFAVTKKVGPAVTRNRIRRRLRAVIADVVRSTPDLVPSGAILLSVQPEAVGRTPDELRNDVLRLLDALAARRHKVWEDR